MGHEPKSRSQATALAEGVSLEPRGVTDIRENFLKMFLFVFRDSRCLLGRIPYISSDETQMFQ